MADGKKPHKKIWFGRNEHRDLDRLPSANAQHAAVAKGSRFLHFISRSILWALAICLLGVVAAVGWLATVGFSSDYFSRSAENLIQSMAGPKLDTGLENAKLSLDGSGNLAFEGSNLSLQGVDTASLSGNVDKIQIGLKGTRLLSGALEIGTLEADGLALVLPENTDPEFWNQFKTASGQLSPAKLPVAVSALVGLLHGQLSGRAVDAVTLSNISISRENSVIVFPGFSELSLQAADEGGYAISGMLTYAGKALPLEGRLDGSANYEFKISGLEFGTSVADPNATGVKFKSGASGAVRIVGSQSDGKRRLVVENLVDEFAWTSRRDVRFGGVADLTLEMIEGSDKVEILPSSITMGSNRFAFTGAIAPAAASEPSKPTDYRFEIVSNNSVLEPSESPESAMELGYRLAGTLDFAAKSIRFSEMAARSKGGELYGQGTMRFLGGTPEMIFGLRIPRLTVADAKQLWPAMIASTARKWVLDHVFGGVITDSQIDVTFRNGYFDPLPPGMNRTPLTQDQVVGDFNVENTRFDVIGDLPPIRDATGHVEVRGADTVVTVSKGIAYLDGGQSVDIANGKLAIPFVPNNGPVLGNLSMDIKGKTQSLAAVANREPINAMQKTPFSVADLSGDAVAHVDAVFPLKRVEGAPKTVWDATVDFRSLAIAKPFNGQKLTEAEGKLTIDQSVAKFVANGKLNGIPADISLTEPIGSSGAKRDFDAKLKLDDKARAALMPGLGDMLKGVVSVEVSDGGNGAQLIKANLKSATLNLPWAGWSKGAGVPAQATLKYTRNGTSASISDFELEGETFRFAGKMAIDGGKLTSADFGSVRLNRNDNASVSIQRSKGGYDVDVKAKSLDLRSLLKKVLTSFESTAKSVGSDTVRVNATIGSAGGFGSETLQNLKASYTGKGSTVLAFTASAITNGGGAVVVENRYTDGKKTVQIETADGGSLLRFLDYYDKMQGGQISVSLTSQGDGPLSGVVDASNFTIVGEPRLKSLVGTPVTPDGQSVAKAAKSKIDVSRVKFQRGYSIIQKGNGFLKLAKGILRSDQIGLSYEGTLYDEKGRIDMSGTFLPAYGLNRIFGDIPIIGDILGNGRDNGLIGITFKLSGPAKSPKLSVNPLSLVAPGIFRQIFEFQ